MIYLHVGLGKCGSSTIQHFATVHSEALREAGVTYPALNGRHPEHHKTLCDFAMSSARRGAKPPQAIAALLAELRERPDAAMLLSSENFLKHEPRRAASVATAMRALLGQAPVRILIYIRQYPSWVESLYAQRTKRGENAESIDGFIRDRQILDNVSMVSGLKEWIRVFGAENIRLRSLDRANLVGGDLITDLLDAIELRSDMPAMPRVNESPDWTFLELARLIASRRPDQSESTQLMFRTWLKRLAEATGAALQRADVKAPKPQYLTQADWLLLSTLYNSDVTQINGLLPGHAVPLLNGSLIPERVSAPSFDAIPDDVWSVYREVIGNGKLLLRMPEPVRNAIRPILKLRRKRLRRTSVAAH